MARRVCTDAEPICGSSTVLGASSSACGTFGSSANTSSPAAAMVPPASAAASAASSTVEPRPILTRTPSAPSAARISASMAFSVAAPPGAMQTSVSTASGSAFSVGDRHRPRPPHAAVVEGPGRRRLSAGAPGRPMRPSRRCDTAAAQGERAQPEVAHATQSPSRSQRSARGIRAPSQKQCKRGVGHLFVSTSGVFCDHEACPPAKAASTASYDAVIGDELDMTQRALEIGADEGAADGREARRRSTVSRSSGSPAPGRCCRWRASLKVLPMRATACSCRLAGTRTGTVRRSMEWRWLVGGKGISERRAVSVAPPGAGGLGTCSSGLMSLGGANGLALSVSRALARAGRPRRPFRRCQRGVAMAPPPDRRSR